MTWEAGQVVFEHYEVLDVVRRGGMGVVHRVHHREWETDFAVKTPRPELSRDEKSRAAFEREADTWVRLGAHPHVVGCAHVRRLDGLPRVFAEWVDGGSLAEAVAAGRLGLDDQPGLIDTAVQIAWGLAFAHERGLVHQDVKPANVMLEPDGTAKVTDFGLARARAAGGEVSYAGCTPAYCSPEQARSAAGDLQPITAATDVWSWALCVLEMAMGGPPTRHGQAAAEVFEQSGLKLPATLTDLLRRCFQHEPGQRPTMTEAADTVAALIPHPRERPPATGLLADGLSNQALSLLELGEVDSAEEAWRIATGLHPGHPHTVYNQGLHLWRTGRITDEQVVSEMTALAVDPAGRRLLDLLRQERGSDLPGPSLEFTGTGGTVTAVATDHEGRTALSGDEDGALVVWSPPDGKRRHRLSKRGAAVVAVAVDRNGRTGIAARADGSTEVWDLRSGRRTTVINWGTSAASHVAISGDGRTGLTGGHDGVVQVWDLTDGAQVGRLRRHTIPVRALALSPDGRRAVTAAFHGQTGAVVLWDVGAERIERELTGHDDHNFCEVDLVAVSRDARLAVIAEFHGYLLVWDTRSGTVRRTARNPLTLSDRALAVTADAELLVSAGHGRATRFWLTETGRSLHTLATTGSEAHRMVRQVALSGDGRILLIADGREGVRVRPVPPTGVRAPWSYARSRDAGRLVTDQAAFAAALERSDRAAGSGDVAAAAAELRRARTIPGFAAHPWLLDRWNELGSHGRRTELLGVWPSHELESIRHFTQPVRPLLTADGNRLLTGGADGYLRVWERGKLIYTFPERNGRISAIAFDPEEHYAASVSNDGAVRVWDPDTAGCRAALPGATGRATAFALTTTEVVVGDENGAVQVWNLETGTSLLTIPGEGGRVDSLAVHPDGTRLLVASTHPDRPIAGDVRLFTYPDGEFVARDDAGRDARVLYSPDGAHLLIHVGGSVLSWDPSTLEYRWHHFFGFPGAMAVGADWRLGVAGGFEKPIVFEPSTGRVRRRLDNAGFTQVAAVTRDSRFAATGGVDRRVLIWDLDRGELVRTLEGHRTMVTDLVWNADGSLLVSCDASPAVHQWRCDWDYEFV
ncbi:protein kinase [Actinoplanes sp. LDG1-06]|uniref:Protein kinase n=1 Tax=Paractinoplanes ovalisporus TaxID=2810368 RepID=A0ABS2A4X0_9ACTN|nr:serine/threonine-protein kinase [Actinoplanes ovalisporus]MBM2614890.1 protein kinase [Actinoplanes ovalisporus]